MNSLALSQFLLERGFNLVGAKALSHFSLKLQNTLLELNPDLKHKTLLLIGAGGPLLWSILKKEKTIEGDLFDNYSLEISKEIEELFSLSTHSIAYPNHEIHYPLQQISREIFNSRPTPSGLEMSREYGMWFGFRALIVLNKNIEIAYKYGNFSRFPCDECANRPCLTPQKGIEDLRLNCPYMTEKQYSPEQIEHHCHHLNNLKKRTQGLDLN